MAYHCLLRFFQQAALRCFSLGSRGAFGSYQPNPTLKRRQDEVRKRSSRRLMSEEERGFMGSRKQSGPLNNPHDLGKLAHSC